MDNDSANNKTDFLIQVEGVSGGSVTPQTNVEDFIKGSKEHLHNIANIIEMASDSFIEKVQKSKNSPSDISVEFGVNVGGETGVPFVTKGSVGANFKVTVSWKRL
jgi:hypothetical protein